MENVLFWLALLILVFGAVWVVRKAIEDNEDEKHKNDLRYYDWDDKDDHGTP